MESNDTRRTRLSFPYRAAGKATRKPREERGGCGHSSVCPGPVSCFAHQTPPVFPVFKLLPFTRLGAAPTAKPVFSAKGTSGDSISREG